MPRYKGAQFQTNPKFKNKFNLDNGAFGKKVCLYNVRIPSAHPPQFPPASCRGCMLMMSGYDA